MVAAATVWLREPVTWSSTAPAFGLMIRIAQVVDVISTDTRTGTPVTLVAIVPVNAAVPPAVEVYPLMMSWPELFRPTSTILIPPDVEMNLAIWVSVNWEKLLSFWAGTDRANRSTLLVGVAPEETLAASRAPFIDGMAELPG